MTVEKWLESDNELGISIWNKKYRQGNESFDEWLTRVSGGDTELRQLILEKKFLFGGRILANRGVTKRKITLSNCYVITPPEDNIESIFECATKLARTFSYGGGCGIDLSKLRPNGASTNNAAKESTGPVSFMEIFSQVTGTISQAGRRGALMISLDVNHPDIEEFVNCKTDLSKVNYANISLRISDEFMKAVEEDHDYMLKYPCDMKVELNSESAHDFNKMDYGVLYQYKDGYIKKIKARELFTKLAKNNWDYAEPGVLYWDNISNYNLLNNDSEFSYAGVNPCAEEPLPAGGSCLLGSLNLSAFVKNPFTKSAFFDKMEFAHAIAVAVYGLNKVLDEGLPLHPLKEQQITVMQWRQIGLGTMGLADCLIKLGMTYGSKESLDFIDMIYHWLAIHAVCTSAELAEKDGKFPMCTPNTLMESNFMKELGRSLGTENIKKIQRYGLRNSQLLTCAPTGTLSTMLGISGGVEPIFAMKYTRMTKSLEGKDKSFDIYTPIAKKYLEEHTSLPNFFVESKDIKPEDRIKVQATIQKWTDASISSTINLPESATVEDVFNIYLKAWQQGLKGVTVFRQGCARTAILSTGTSKKEEKKGVIFDSIVPVSRKQMGVTRGCTFCKKCACGTLYVTLNRDKDGHLVELFTHTSKGGICQANLNAETRMASLALRSGVKIAEVVDQLKGISCPACTAVKAKGGKIDGISCADIIAKTIVEFENPPKTNPIQIVEFPTTAVEAANPPARQDYEECPECHQKTLIREAGCQSCPSCGYSKCNS